jgi:hypothetical protein
MPAAQDSDRHRLHLGLEPEEPSSGPARKAHWERIGVGDALNAERQLVDHYRQKP